VTQTKTLIVLAAAAVITAGCGGSNTSQNASGTASSSQPSTVNPSDMSNNQAPPTQLVIEVTIRGGNVTPTNEQLQAAVNEQIIVKINSDADDELHVHSTPDHTFKVDPKSGQSFQFTVSVPGNVDVELHKANKTIATIAVQ
jgi:ABC-type glycerol-3-phosphate transport system substrate-binding protein